MQISILLAQQIAQLFLILIMGYAVVKAGLLKASDSRVLSVVMVYMEKLFDAALAVPEISGVILNPWNRTIQLDKTLIRIIKGA